MITADAQPWSKDAAPVWALVSGLPGDSRRQRALMMLQAFVDDSFEHPVFVLAGYVAPAERWALFSDRWREVLSMPPGIDAFKMSQSFSGWSPERRDERLILLHDVIDEFASAAFTIAFNIDKFKEAFGPVADLLGKPNSNPHLFAYSRLMVSVAKHQADLKLEGPIKFIFDEQLTEKKHLFEAWDWAWKVAKPTFPNLKNIIGGTPSFEDDKKFLPLQAADLLAWWMRRSFVAQDRGTERPMPPWRDRPSRVPAMLIQYDGQQLRDEAYRVLKRAQKFSETGR